MSDWLKVSSLLQQTIANRVFPGAVAEVGDREQVLWRAAFGTRTFDPSAPRISESTIFDLASLTKPLATTTLMMRLAARGEINIEQPLLELFREWRGADRSSATIRDLLEHSSGLAARLVDPPPTARREFEHDICAMPLEYAPRTKSVYSDLGFILLGFLIEDRGGASLAHQFDVLAQELGLLAADANDVLQFDLSAALRSRAAPTLPMDEDIRRGRVLAGEVHDNYAAALGGVAGHAGLFGTSGAVGAFARAYLEAAVGNVPASAALSSQLVAQTTRRSTVPGSSRALGWDTMLPTSSCGEHMSPQAFGHVGFTGTSVWIHSGLDRYFVLLTNRAYGGGSLDAMRDVRRAFHDAALGFVNVP